MTDTIKKHAQSLADAWISKDDLEKKINDVIIEFIEPRKMTEKSIEDYLTFFGEAMVKAGRKQQTVGVYKSNVKRVLKLAMTHKDEVIKLGKNAGNLNQWYNACATPSNSRNKNPKVNTPKPVAVTEPKLGEDEKKPSESRDPIADFKASVQTMLEVGMTIDQIHAMVDDLAKKAA
jgi:hypothetical protein